MFKVRALTMAAVAAGSLALGVGTAAPASAEVSHNCQLWTDATTFGANCLRDDYAIVFRAKANCKNGQTVYGAWKATGGGTWSYAYCSSVNSGVATVDVEFK
ncbi:hypothetical protein ACFU7Y_44185 [Kitasatospora sp. NPDC057542]|uniref:hypothetical protein n=1 Tax=Kitasatospora sp. NPDC057542 TaxID=3346162 RepID=UPI00369A3054